LLESHKENWDRVYTVRVSWEDASDAKYYRLYWASGSSSGTYYVIARGSAIYGTSFDADIPSGYTYYFKVTASNSYGESSKSSSVSVTGEDSGSSGYTPSTPSNVNTDVLSRSSIKVSWNYVPEATSYNVYYAKGDSSTKQYVGKVTDNGYGTIFSYTHTGLSPNTNYWYYITAVNSYGESDYSIVKLGHTSSY
jgi:predicted phage tail protein